MTRLNAGKTVLQYRKRCWLLSTLFVLTIFGDVRLTMSAPPPASLTSEIETQLHGTIMAASTEDLIKAIKLLVAQNPQQAPGIIAVLGKAHRSSRDCEMSKFVAAALALGDNPSRSLVLAIVHNAVTAEPLCAPAIVTAAIKGTPPTFSDDIVETAVAALPDPTVLIGDITITEAITKAAFAALDMDLPPIGEAPGSDSTGILGAANRGLLASLVALYGRTLGTLPAADFQNLVKVLARLTVPRPASSF